ncbi:MAG: hypothetical protein KBB37_02470 [Bacteroidia bacterium]|nr:hypothetical protein [Bacteroidia bacterium]MBP7260125.1 hypothetical protein [Bacteroidia bacterium]MBP9179486.1 hypothetical protein [Bacteroidia bacterium]MBP9723752.1 hypothetical protein [Bacteroidia bacterium]
MKNMFNTCRLIIALTFLSAFTAQAEDEPKSMRDTLIIRLEGNNQVRIVAPSFGQLSTYKKADSLLTLFVADVQRANAGKEYSNWPQTMHYLVQAEGKRRLKMQNNEFTEQEFDLSKETYRLDENLPAYHYTVYDLGAALELHVYLESADKITLLQQHSVDSAVKALLKMKKERRRYYRMELNRENTVYTLGKTKSARQDAIEISPDINAYLIGNQWTPTIGFEAKLTFRNKYGVPNISVGGAMMSYVFSDFSAGKFNGFTHNIGYDGRVAFNMNSTGSKPYWFGIEGGVIVGPEKGYTEGFKGTAYRYALITELHGLGFSFGAIRDSYKRSIPTIGIRLPF